MDDDDNDDVHNKMYIMISSFYYVHIYWTDMLEGKLTMYLFVSPHETKKAKRQKKIFSDHMKIIIIEKF